MLAVVSTTSALAKVISSDPIKTISIRVKGVTCSSDLKTIAANVEKVNGVNRCQAVKEGPTSTFEVIFDSSVVTKKQIHSAIEATAGCKNPNDRPYKIKL